MQVFKWSSWDLLSPLVSQKMKEDYFSQLDDHDEPFYERQYTRGSCLFVCTNSNPSISLIPPERPQILDIYSVVVL